MPDRKEIVINTGPLIALVAAVGDLTLLNRLYSRILVPFEVCGEMVSPVLPYLNFRWQLSLKSEPSPPQSEYF
jgi:hypothetical protein